jgi:prepilin-type N-terminal cleavage/methylation domain-containing protein
MHIHRNPTHEHLDDGEQDKGFTLIEILIAIVLVGILSAVAVVGISNLVSKGNSSACTASGDAAKAASAVYFASNNRYPVSFTELTAAGTDGAPLAAPTGATVAATTITKGWVLTLAPGTGGAAPTFTCTNTG